MLAVQNLGKMFAQEWVVKGVNFTLREGEVLALLGGSGSGKTTTLKMLNRLYQPDSGAIWLRGQAIDTLSAIHLRRMIGYVVQHFGLLPHYTVAQNIAIVPQLLGWQKHTIQEAVEQMLARVGLPYTEFAHRLPHQLSGGQQQRVGIARALAGKPALLLMDEPFGALDTLTRQNLQDEFLRWQHDTPTTTVLVTHDIREAFRLGHQVALMHQGSLLQQGTAADFLLRPANDSVRAFFASLRFELSLEFLTVRELVADSTLPPALAALPLKHFFQNPKIDTALKAQVYQSELLNVVMLDK